MPELMREISVKREPTKSAESKSWLSYFTPVHGNNVRYVGSVPKPRDQDISCCVQMSSQIFHPRCDSDIKVLHMTVLYGKGMGGGGRGVASSEAWGLGCMPPE